MGRLEDIIEVLSLTSAFELLDDAVDALLGPEFCFLEFDFFHRFLGGESNLVAEIYQSFIRSSMLFHQLPKFKMLFHELILNVRLEKIHEPSIVCLFTGS